MQYLYLPKKEQTLFDPEIHLAGVSLPLAKEQTGKSKHVNFSDTLPLYLATKAHPQLSLIPREEDCTALWEKYCVYDHIRAHSTLVSDSTVILAKRACELGRNINIPLARACGLLHDLGKTYCIRYKGNHAQLGAAWVMQETRNGVLAQSILYHVHWPWEEKTKESLACEDGFIILALLYADKRVMHDKYVSLDQRYIDLFERYGTTPLHKKNIQKSYEQGKRIEIALSDLLGVQLDECSFDSGRLVY